MRAWVLGVSVLLLLGCSSRPPAVRTRATDQFEQARSHFEKKRYKEAADGFQRVIFEHPGSELVDDAQYYLAESYFFMKDYSQAMEEYRFLLDNLPQSTYRDEALFRLGVCYYESAPSYHHDQTQTRKALDTLEDFAMRFPDSELLPQVEEYRRSCLEKLARKQLETGRHYLKRGKYSSAEVYLKDGTERYTGTKHGREFYLLLGECYQKKGDAEKALEVYRNIAEGKDRLAREARKRLKEMEEGE